MTNLTIEPSSITVYATRIGTDGMWNHHPTQEVSFSPIGVADGKERRTDFIDRVQRAAKLIATRADRREVHIRLLGSVASTTESYSAVDIAKLLDAASIGAWVPAPKVTDRAGRVIVAIGNAFDGMSMHGSFDSVEEADNWVRRTGRDCEPYEIILLTDPEAT
jgi:hypothetical protein